MRREEKLGWIIVIGLLILFLILGFSGIDLTKLMINFNQKFYNKLGEWGVYIATFLLSIFGSFTVIIPVPYLFSIMSIMLTLPVNPVILSLFAALGASIGELSAWLFGRGAAEVVSEETINKRIKGLSELIDKGFGFWLIILFAATPLPDDLLLIALGLKEFPLKTTIIASFIGKLTQLSLIVLSVFALKKTYVGNLILNLFGFTINNGVVTSNGNTIISSIMMVGTILITIIIMVVDWSKLKRRIKRWLSNE